ncbi:hypothetical protein JCGZ_02290 [Jatropha curcas]|uniref:C2H2-type domain-containing protein n=1 Tax=Jatropha curcas TaxID=180498 RepID=A0A067KVZ0_JATCU|nr:transcriptional regulator TAC1 [Jatropha curcas]KDP40292.1 hypothetical protein JCGZ_02290 [Jatropha curcas]
MGSGKQGSSESSSDENNKDQQEEQVKETTISSSKRSYECTFCRRGFTNAQALGGHMNIHRKDRAKTKQVSGSNSISSKINEEDINPNHVRSISSEPINHCPVIEAQKNYHPMYFQASRGSSSIPMDAHGYYHASDFLVSKNQSLSLNDEQLWGANLSLQIGSNNLEENNETISKEVSKEDEVDLELRLGHDHWSDS